MRREPWFAVGLLLAAIAEVQWAATFYGDENVHAILLFAAACGFLLAAAGVFFAQGAWTWQVGLAVAAAAHVGYLGLTYGWGPLLLFAALFAAGGLTLAAAGAWMRGRENLVRVGLFAAALGGAVWLVADALSGDLSFMVGNVFAMIGWGVAAGFVPEKMG